MDTMVPWADLPAEILFKIEQSCSQTEGMRGACKDWRVSLQSCTTQVAITGTPLPLSIATRFTNLTALDLRSCPSVSTAALAPLQGLPLASLSLEIEMRDLSMALLQSLRDLSLASLDLQFNQNTSNRGLYRLADMVAGSAPSPAALPLCPLFCRKCTSTA